MAPQPSDVSSDGASSPSANKHTALPRALTSYPQILREAPKYLYRTTKTTLFFSKANFLLPFVPLSIIAANPDHPWSPVATFSLSFLAIFPLAELLSWSTEQLSASTGQTIGGLLNATFGNAVEMIVRLACTAQLNVMY
jgi:Ca2+:H+ antiporter